MQTFNKIVLEINIAIIDFLYQGRDYQRFWAADDDGCRWQPIFAFLSVLHFAESMGLRGREHIDLMLQHFEQSVNETSHLESWRAWAVILIGLIALLPNTSYLSIIGSTWFIIGCRHDCAVTSLLRKRDSCCYNIR